MSVKLAWSDQGNAKALTFDAAPGDTHLWTATVTEHPVEKGVAITDHVRPGAFRLSLDVIVSNMPLSLPDAADDSFTDGVKRSATQVALQLPGARRIDQLAQGPNTPATTVDIAPKAQATVWQWSTPFERVRKVYEALTDLIGDAPPDGITVMTSLAMYDMMEIVNISVPRSVQTGTSAIRFTLEMQQIRTVESETVTPPAPKLALVHKGHKPTKEEADSGRASLLHNTVESATGFLKRLGS